MRSVALLLLLFALPAVAAKKLQVAEDAKIHKKASESSEVVDEVSVGDDITVGNSQSKGFYKVRTQSGKVGWIRADKIRSNITAPKAKVEGAPSLYQHPEKEDASLNEFKKVRFRFHGGWDFFNAKDVAFKIGVDAMRNGSYFGMEFNYQISQPWYLGLRTEAVRKSNSLVDATGNAFELDITSLPIMTGLGWSSDRGGFFFFGASAWVGLGFSTKYKLTALSFEEPNITESAQSVLTYAIKTDLNFKMSDIFAVSLEGGYRILKTSALLPDREGNGIGLIQFEGETQAITVDLSGFFLGVAVVLSL